MDEDKRKGIVLLFVVGGVVHTQQCSWLTLGSMLRGQSWQGLNVPVKWQGFNWVWLHA